ncbi:arsenic resistance protein [Guyparkeria sp. SCN-R1]|uniref:arsenic resistance protein n=1 Tax=Guyparkeria sp. SCN-R1 TaxID=2341113 RepID=UPI000F652B2A|nr:arsenic resistance protein [Guyparkeria sp. SCN-R1]RRQ20298.1 arsenic resistance protein [Guyparkeria sp. SCN-R1]
MSTTSPGFETRLLLEKYQVVVYLIAVAAGVGIGLTNPPTGDWLDWLIWPLLTALLYVTFTQTHLGAIGQAFGDRRFLTVMLAVNFLLVPLLVWGLTRVFVDDPVLALGVSLVLLVPCTDWFISFSQLGRADVPRAIAATPLLLLAQILLLPVYLWAFTASDIRADLPIGSMIGAFVLIILLPLLAGWLTDIGERRRPTGPRWTERLAWLPVPLLAVVLLVIMVGHAPRLTGELAMLWPVALVFVLYVLIVPWIAEMAGRLANLPVHARRTVAFSAGSRNSFMVLPIALALPGFLQPAVTVIILQSLIELVGLIAYTRVIPRVIR